MFGLPLHPSIIHFPIALAVVGALAEVAYLAVRRPWLKFMAPILLTIALLGATGAYFSGQAAEDPAEHQGVPESEIESHQQAGIIAFVAIGLAALLSWATRPKNGPTYIAALMALIAAGLVLYAGHKGGRLVYVHGAGRVTQGAAGAAGTGAAGESGERGGEGGEHGEHEGGERH